MVFEEVATHVDGESVAEFGVFGVNAALLMLLLLFDVVRKKNPHLNFGCVSSWAGECLPYYVGALNIVRRLYVSYEVSR